MNPTEMKRNYLNTDAQMTEFARVAYNLMNSDLAKFTAFDSTLTAAYATQFLTAITAAETVVADTAVVDIQVQKTELIQTAMEKAKGKYADVKYFVQKTFPSSVATQNEFGLNDYERARKSSPQMIQFLDEMSKACVKYQTQLVAKGFNAAAIAEILTIRTELETANTNQEVFKKQRPKLTEDRIIVLNRCYNFIAQINAAAQRVYKDDFAKQKQFVYTVSSTSGIVTLSGEVAANSTKNAGTIPFSTDNVFTFKNVGLVPLIFCLSATDTVEGTEVAIGGGATISKAADELNAGATNILVKNTDATGVGAYEIEVDD
jgi:hypothetical protein